MSQQDHILIVDDDRDIRSLLADYLEKQGLRCTTAGDGREMKAALEQHRVDLIVLDVMMPGEDGLTLCRNLRAAGGPPANLPILMLTARGDDMDRILGLEMGADDYLTKPFVPRELYARIRAVLRRTRALPPNLDAAPPANARELRFAQWRLDTVNRHLIDAAGTVVALSGAEYRMLSIFLSHPQKILSRDQLMELTQGREADVFDRSIDLQISRLRQRLGDNAREPAIIKTVRNEGYVLATDVGVVVPDAATGAS
ncbi:response regulator [Thauera linaloolentis]|uniref:Winged helix family two component transcriptional regulator n=1 Tax=Thauera linaloolentis (strain DSM 12138 / JCM 21573 / CCUG 41526 / CIP 105981 / IAM 15112 / NBRC 102519 / 47Lol) TaxID=1123367 RepID=N6YD79_THAL4|nr:response regulator [Thauera linaloolentis]ENO89480.1 winged helix family two component transcriptional regulator [Thauera linaloolentis 47Lol = DSM 12138]MCM8566883.1 response regulator [Thauera linaloolentis]